MEPSLPAKLFRCIRPRPRSAAAFLLFTQCNMHVCSHTKTQCMYCSQSNLTQLRRQFTKERNYHIGVAGHILCALQVQAQLRGAQTSAAFVKGLVVVRCPSATPAVVAVINFGQPSRATPCKSLHLHILATHKIERDRTLTVYTAHAERSR